MSEKETLLLKQHSINKKATEQSISFTLTKKRLTSAGTVKQLWSVFHTAN